MEFRTNQGTGFYIIGTTVEKELMVVTKKDDDRFFTKDFSQDILKRALNKKLKLLQALSLQSFTLCKNMPDSKILSISSHQRCSVKKDVHKKLENVTVKHLCWSKLVI